MADDLFVELYAKELLKELRPAGALQVARRLHALAADHADRVLCANDSCQQDFAKRSKRAGAIYCRPLCAKAADARRRRARKKLRTP